MRVYTHFFTFFLCKTSVVNQTGCRAGGGCFGLAIQYYSAIHAMSLCPL